MVKGNNQNYLHYTFNMLWTKLPYNQDRDMFQTGYVARVSYNISLGLC